MAEYMEREAAMQAFLAEKPDAHYPGWYAGLLEELPAADVAPVVRCKDCTYATLYEDSEGLYCTNICGLFTRVMDDDYCSYGGRKDGAERSGT